MVINLLSDTLKLLQEDVGEVFQDTDVTGGFYLGQQNRSNTSKHRKQESSKNKRGLYSKINNQ